MVCHAVRGWTLSEEYFLSSQLVVAGSPADSPLYRYLKGNPEGYIPGSMPDGGAALPQEQIAAIRDWISSIPAPTPTPPAGHFACLPSMQVGTSIMQRLTKEQLRNSLYDLAFRGLADAWRAEFLTWTSAWHITGTIPDDFSQLGHSRLDTRLDESYLEGVFRLMENFVNGLHSSNRVAQFVRGYVPSCTSTIYLSEACRDEFLRQFGKAVLKSTLSQADFDFYRRPNAGGQSQATYREMMLALLMAPKFLFHLESKGTPIDASGLVLRISAQEWVTRMAYTVWNSIPDLQLIQYAEDGTADQNPGLVVSYLLEQNAARAQKGIKDFFQGWLKVDHSMDEIARYFEVDGIVVPFLGVSYSGSSMPLVAAPITAQTARTQLLEYRQDAENEILELGAILTFVQPAPVSELFRTQLAPVRAEASRRNYNLPAPWDGEYGNIPSASEDRRGILTRPAFHLTRGARKRAIITGRRLREDILCDPTGLPANNSTPQGVNTNSLEYRTGSTQSRIRALTEQAGTNCGGCHQPWINPLGFAMEDIDSLGRRRFGEEVVLEDVNNQGLQEFRRPYERTVVPRVKRSDSTPVTGIEGLSEAIATSDEMHACFTRNIVRFTMHRPESEAGDGCFMNEIFEDAKSLPMNEVLRRVLLSPTYRLRRLNASYP